MHDQSSGHATMPAVGGDSGIPFGNYTLLRRIARGGMAEVFVARQKGIDGFDRLVAIKRILPHLLDDKSFVGMFQDEARLAARLSHPNVIHIYDFGKVEEHFFIAMQFMHGVHAGDLIRLAEDVPMPASLVARIGADACSGLHYAHNRRDERGSPLKLVHRDVSPPNLLVSYDGIVKIVDFGIAKAVSSLEQTRPGVVKGKYAYMSPEQTMGQKLDGRSDVFSLAIVLWELLAGMPAVTRADQVEAMKTIRDGKVPNIESVRKDVPKPLAAALRGALQRDPKKRSDARAFGNQLESYLKASSEIASSMELGAWLTERSPPDEILGADKTGFGTRQATMATALKDGSGMLSELAELDMPRSSHGSRGSIVSALPGVAPLAEHQRPLPGLAEHRRPKAEHRTKQAEQIETRVLAAASGDLQARTAVVRSPSIDDSVLIDRELMSGGQHTSTTQLQVADVDYLVPTGELEELNFDAENEPTAMVQLPVATAVLPRLPKAAPQGMVPPLEQGLGAPTVVDEAAPPPPLEFIDNDLTYEDHPAAAIAPAPAHQRAPTPTPVRSTMRIHAAPPPKASSRKLLWIASGLALLFIIAIAVLATNDRTPIAANASTDPQTSLDAGSQATLPPMLVTPLQNDAGAKKGHAADAVDENAAADAAPVEAPDARPTPLSTSGSKSESKRERRERERRERKRNKPKVDPGRLAVKTSPYSVVYHQGRKLGTTPMANVSLPPGRYRLVFKNPEFKNATRTAVIRSGETTKLDFALEP